MEISKVRKENFQIRILCTLAILHKTILNNTWYNAKLYHMYKLNNMHKYQHDTHYVKSGSYQSTKKSILYNSQSFRDKYMILYVIIILTIEKPSISSEHCRLYTCL